MKFISKNQNLRVVLKVGIPAEPITGRTAVPGLYAKFERGVLEVPDENQEMIQLLLRHPGLKTDYISAEDTGGKDPYELNRTEPEPVHQITEMQFGHPVKTINPRPVLTLSPETKRILSEMAMNMAKEMAPKMAMELLVKLKAQSEEEKPKELEKTPEVTSEPELVGKKDKQPEEVLPWKSSSTADKES